MRIPSEGELIEMQAKFDALVEMAERIKEIYAENERDRGNRGNADDLDAEAAELMAISELADSLLDLVRSQMAVPR